MLKLDDPIHLTALAEAERDAKTFAPGLRWHDAIVLETTEPVRHGQSAAIERLARNRARHVYAQAVQRLLDVKRDERRGPRLIHRSCSAPGCLQYTTVGALCSGHQNERDHRPKAIAA